MKTTQHTKEHALVRAQFGIDEWGPFNGYWYDWDRWNGWAKPYFPIETVLVIARLLEDDPDRNWEAKLAWPPSHAGNPKSVQLMLRDCIGYGGWDVCDSELTDVVGDDGQINQIRLWDICTCNWCWEEWFQGADCCICQRPEGDCKCSTEHR